MTAVLRAEWTKFRTLRGWVVAVILAAVLMDLFGLFAAGHSNIACNAGGRVMTGSACRQAIPTGPGGEAVRDSFSFVHRPLGDRGSITVRVASLSGRYSSGNPVAGQNPPAAMRAGLEPWSKVGIIVKASTAQGSAYAAMMLTGSHGVRMQYDYTHDVAGLPGAASPRWLRLTRSGATITGYDSADGAHWTKVGTAHLGELGAIAQVGLFAASPDHVETSRAFGGSSSTGGPSQATGVFDHVTLSGAAPGAGWTGVLVGASGPPVRGAPVYGRQGGRFTVTGSGDMVPVVPGGGPGPISTIESHLLGTFVGLIVVAVLGAMFITAEYRRGLIRTTLAAIPRRGQVLAAKAIVIGAVTFLAGLASAIVAVAVGVRLARDEGQFVLPVSALTQARVIAGTAALLAVAAVLALAVGTILRRSAAAITAVIVGIVLPYILGTASMLPLGAAQWILRVTPAAGFAIEQSIPRYAHMTADYAPPDYFPLSPWAGFAVLCGYAAAAMAVAFVVLRRRDA
jgi:ABC-type transport system involved in multi-copper enzyme maturation permease subunit/regulation of enolase protein 1 (concanavalin A-like superfamily)